MDVSADRVALPTDRPELYINRELSWLAFNRRVLAQAQDASHPLLERVKFLAIVATNLDEFFMIRVAALLKQLRSQRESVSSDGLTTQQQLALVRERSLVMLADQGRCWDRDLRPALADAGIRFVDPPDYTAAGCSAAGRVLQAAVEKLGQSPALSEDDRGKLNDLIAATDLPTFYGPIKFATEGDHFHNNTALNPMLVQIQGGQVKAIAPPESAEAPIIYPLPPLG